MGKCVGMDATAKDAIIYQTTNNFGIIQCGLSWKETLMLSNLKYKNKNILKGAIAKSRIAKKNTVNVFRPI